MKQGQRFESYSSAILYQIRIVAEWSRFRHSTCGSEVRAPWGSNQGESEIPYKIRKCCENPDAMEKSVGDYRWRGMPERFRIGPEDYISGKVLRIDTIAPSGPASLKSNLVLASSSRFLLFTILNWMNEDRRIYRIYPAIILLPRNLFYFTLYLFYFM